MAANTFMIRSDVGTHLSMVRSARQSSSLVGTVVVSGYAHPDEGRRQELRRPHLADVRDQFVGIAREHLGFGDHLAIDGGGTGRRQIWDGLEDFLAHDAERKILYWTGHGVHRGSGGYFLACEDTWGSGRFAPEHALSVTDLVDRLLRPDCETDTLLIIDACSSHDHLTAALRHALGLEQRSVNWARQHRRAGFAVIGTSGFDAQVAEGRWVRWLKEALVKPDFVAPDHARPFEPSALYLPLPYLRDAVDAEAAASGLDEPTQRPGFTEVRSLPNSFLLNPHFRDGERRIYTPATLVGRKPWDETEQFGLGEDGHLRRHFAGRQRALARIVRWMDTHPRGLLVVTGLAGAGKTALLGRIALTSTPERREVLGTEADPATLPRTGTVHAALSCRGRSVHSLITALWQVLSHFEEMEAPPSSEGPVTPEQCRRAVDRLVAGAGSLNLLFDALDEALPDQAHDIARQLLNPLAGLSGVRVVVATRAQPRRRTIAPTEEESLLDTLDQSVGAVVLGDDEEARRSITDMALSVLDTEGSPYEGPDRADVRDTTARLVAEGSHGSFLVARLAAAELARRPRAVTEHHLASWMRSGGMDLHERLAEEVRHLQGQRGAERAHEVLRALAVLQGPGLPPGRTWLSMANALRDPRTPEITPGDLRAVCGSAGGGIVDVQTARHGDGTAYTVHQLAHPSYGEFFLTGAGLSAQEAHRKVLEALRVHVARDWGNADAYTAAYLGSHAAQAGPEELYSLFQDVEFLLRTDPDVMVPFVAALARECDEAALYGRVAGSFGSSSFPPSPDALLARKALLRATAFVSHRDGAYRALAGADGFLPWEEYWTDRSPEPVEWRRAAPPGGAMALSWRARTGAGDPLLGDTLTAGGRGELLVLHPETGARLMSRRARGSSGERASALTEAREVGTGPHRTTVARDAEAVYFWSSGSRLPDQVYRWGGAVGALAAAERASETVVLAADGRRMWMWSWKSGLPRHGGPLTDIRRMNVDRLAALSIGSRLFVLAAGNRAELYEVHPAATGADRILRERSDLGALDAPARAAAAYAAPVPSPVAHGPSAGRARDEARQGWIAVADGRRIRVWCCETDPAAPLAPPTVRLVRELESPARGLVFGRHDAELLIAGYEEVTVRVWAVGGARREAAFQLDAPRDGAMAFEPHGRGLLAVADGPDIRMLDVASALNTGHGTRRRPSNQRPEVALAEAPHGPPLLCRTWGDRVLVSRPVPGAAAATPVTTLTHQGLVTAVAAVHTAGGWAVVAAAERTVRMWRLSEDDLSAEGRHDLRLGGDAGERVPSLGLVVDPSSARLRLCVPDGGSVVHADAPADGSGGWSDGKPTWVGLQCCGVDTRVMRDGTYWLATDLSDGLRLWKHGEERRTTEHPLTSVRPAHLTLGERYDPEDEESFPVLAWTDGGVYVKDCSAGFGLAPQRLPGPVSKVTALAFAGPPEHPVLLVCDERTVRVWDVAARRWLHEPGVPWRGYTVHAVDAALDPEGLVVALQGSDRCDLIRLPGTYFTD
ncbi:peptidase C14 caspase catalytic subunit p20 [Streptomyces sp. NBC_01255]|uniref:peptidase C14 caspase catalytic subunit p20 n=1 Tax=Streptomyces sp. NBC_01255 TaxID=2903798 RepID=UPI002E37E1CB|nr:peptidase C14 caspase catalytic subunit p20 [Streptomyces sp. NBC_01255]